MEYKKISKLYIQNFRNIGEVTIDFTKSPIVTLLGENEAGKTSVIKAFAVCALHSNPKDQRDYIRDGTDRFGVAIELEDGTMIIRQKEAKDGNAKVNNSYTIKYSDGTSYKIDKLAEGLPVEVSNLMGLIEEPETKEYLHIRSYEDKLLFVVTPNSTNYKVIYNALKVEHLTKAISIGSKEANDYKAKIATNENSIETLNDEIRNISIIDTEQLISVRESIKKQIAQLEKIEKCKNLCNRVKNCSEQIGAIALIDKFELKDINILTASKLNSASKLINSRNEKIKVSQKLSELNSISEIDTLVINKVSKLLNMINNHRELINRAGSLSTINKNSEISESVIIHLSRLSNLLNKKKSFSNGIDYSILNSYNEITNDDINRVSNISKLITLINNDNNNKNMLKQCTDYISQVENYLKSLGVATETCPKCGETIIFDIDKAN